jgi:CubicO group peptidase (beta-lactamase class C family)
MQLVEQVLNDALSADVFPAAQACVIHEGRCVHSSAHGTLSGGVRRVNSQTLFDVASVTKVLATTTAAAVLLSRRAIRLDDPVAHTLPPFGEGRKQDITIRQLLAHSSGLPAWSPLFEEARQDPVGRGIYPGPSDAENADLALAFEAAGRRVVEAALRTRLERPTGQRLYSDIGFIVLGEVIAAAASEPLDRFCAGEVFHPLDLRHTAFRRLPGSRAERPAARIAPTGDTRPREPAPGQEMLYGVHSQTRALRPGEVDDDNAYAMAGVAGHAGVFSTANDIAQFGWKLFEEIEGSRALGDPAVFQALATLDHDTSGPERTLGFDRPTGEASSAGTQLGGLGPRGAIGHLGFTGASLWIDLDRKLSIALLTNRVFPTRRNAEGIRALRPRFHDAVLNALD